MPALIFRQSAAGVIVQATVTPSSKGITLLGGHIPSATVELLLDTGAEYSSLDESVIALWGLGYTGGHSRLTGSGQRQRVRMYELAFELASPGGGVTSWKVAPLDVSVAGDPYSRASKGLFRGLLGRDALSGAIVIYNGLQAHCTIAF